MWCKLKCDFLGKTKICEKLCLSSQVLHISRIGWHIVIHCDPVTLAIICIVDCNDLHNTHAHWSMVIQHLCSLPSQFSLIYVFVTVPFRSCWSQHCCSPSVSMTLSLAPCVKLDCHGEWLREGMNWWIAEFEIQSKTAPRVNWGPSDECENS